MGEKSWRSGFEEGAVKTVRGKEKRGEKRKKKKRKERKRKRRREKRKIGRSGFEQ